jgi:hypothetical protein
VIVSAELLLQPFLATAYCSNLFWLLIIDACRAEELSDDQVYFLLQQYMDNGPITPSRKFYFHTDAGKLQKLFKALKVQGIKATIFPDK